jgi:hypothetical protein
VCACYAAFTTSLSVLHMCLLMQCAHAPITTPLFASLSLLTFSEGADITLQLSMRVADALVVPSHCVLAH